MLVERRGSRGNVSSTVWPVSLGLPREENRSSNQEFARETRERRFIFYGEGGGAERTGRIYVSARLGRGDLQHLEMIFENPLYFVQFHSSLSVSLFGQRLLNFLTPATLPRFGSGATSDFSPDLRSLLLRQLFSCASRVCKIPAEHFSRRLPVDIVYCSAACTRIDRAINFCYAARP